MPTRLFWHYVIHLPPTAALSAAQGQPALLSLLKVPHLSRAVQIARLLVAPVLVLIPPQSALGACQWHLQTAVFCRGAQAVLREVHPAHGLTVSPKAGLQAPHVAPYE